VAAQEAVGLPDLPVLPALQVRLDPQDPLERALQVPQVQLVLLEPQVPQERV